MKPKPRFVRVTASSPGIDGLRFACHETPEKAAYAVLTENGQVAGDGADGASHPFGANERPSMAA